MKKKLRKLAIASLAALIAIGSISGCSNKTTETEKVGVGAEVKLNGDKIYPIQCDDTITYWFDGTAVWNQRYENFAETPIAKEVAKETGINVEYIHPGSGQEAEQFQILLASNELPDIVNHVWYSFPGGPDEAISQEYIYELSDIIKEYCPNYAKLLDENEDWAKGIKTDSGNYYAFPSFSDRDTIIKAVYGPVLRKDYLDKFNLELPVTIDDWENVLTTMKNGGVEIPFHGTKGGITTAFYPAFGGYTGWYQDNGVVKFGQAQPQYKEFLEKMADWYKKGLIYQDFAVYDEKRFNADVLNGKAGSFIGYAGSGIGTFLQNAEGIEGFDLAGAQFPVMKDGDVNAEYSFLNNGIPTGVSTAISKNCKNVELAARFLDFGFTEKGHNIYNFGVEGESYNWIEKDGKKSPQFTDLVYNNPEGMTVSDVLHMYTRSAHSNVPMVTDVEYIVQYYSMPQQKNAQIEWAKTNMADHHIPPVYILGEESDEDSSIMATVNTYVDEMTIKFITGRESIDKFDEYLTELEKFGIKTSTEFRQKAFDRYKSR